MTVAQASLIPFQILNREFHSLSHIDSTENMTFSLKTTSVNGGSVLAILWQWANVH